MIRKLVLKRPITIRNNNDGTGTISIGPHSKDFSIEDMFDAGGLDLLIGNIGVALKMDGYSDLTNEAVTNINSRQFIF